MDVPRREIFKLAQQGWSPFVPGPRRLPTAAMTCPRCGRAFHLGNHAIAPDGTVRPSVVCPWKCGFHDWVRLLGWQ